MRRVALTAAAAVAIAFAPAFLGGYELFLLASILLMAVALAGVNILVGHCGILSLGHGAVFALGAYASVLALTRGGVPLAAAPLAGGIFCFLFARAFAFAVLKLEGMPLALATLGLAIVVPQLMRSDTLASWTGGVQGLAFTRAPVPAGLHVSDDTWIYLIVAGWFAACFFTAARLLLGQTGQVWRALRDQPLAASAMGIDVARMRQLAFAVSCGFTGLAGGLSALLVQYVAPDSFPFSLSLALFIGVVVGGSGSLLGCVLGAAFLVLIPNLAENVSQALTGAIYGAAVIGLMVIEKRGLAGLLPRAREMARHLRRSPHPTTET